MNASRPLFRTARTVGRISGAGVCCALLAGCIGNPFKDAKIDPSSPVAADVARITREPAKFPTFASIPNPPTDVRPPRQYRENAQAVLAAGESLRQATEPDTWTLQGTEAFAEAARREAAAPPPVSPSSGADAFVREQRERATPPPPR
jgi:hypothetical protein